MIEKMNIYVVIPSWNGKELLKPCLDSVMAQGQSAEIIMVDNGSSDGSQAFVKASYPGVELIELDKNYGFTGGVNVGINAALKKGAEFVVLFNNDAVAEPDWLEQLSKTAQDNRSVGIVASKILRTDKQHLDSTGENYSIWGLPFPRGRNEVDNGQYDKLIEVFAASGGASIYRAKMLGEIGLFDEDFFAYFEDVDIAFRAQLAGWKVLYEPTAVVYHHVNATSSKLGDFSLYHSSKNFMLLYAKNMPLALYIKYLPLFALQLIRWSITSLLRGKIIAFLRGVFAALGLHFSTVKKRRDIQRSRKVPIKYIDRMLYHHRPPRPPKLEKP